MKGRNMNQWVLQQARTAEELGRRNREAGDLIYHFAPIILPTVQLRQIVARQNDACVRIRAPAAATAARP